MKTITKRMRANAQTSSRGLKELSGSTITVVASDVATIDDKRIGYVWLEDASCYGTISSTAIDTIELIPEIMEEEKLDSIDISVETRKSNAGREYISLVLN